MNYKFSVTLQDNTILRSHDGSEWVKDHAHFLAPHNTIPWKIYTIEMDDGFYIAVDFNTGVFNINGVNIHPSTSYGFILTNLQEKQDFPESAESWAINQGNFYFPVAGRRQYTRGASVEVSAPYCGWKILKDGRKHQRICVIYPNNQVVIE